MNGLGLNGCILILVVFLFLFSCRRLRKQELDKQRAGELARRTQDLSRKDVPPKDSTEHSLSIANLFIYPIKSCRGIQISSAHLSTIGFEHDREFVLCALTTSEDGHPFYKMLTMRNEPRLGLINTAIVDQILHISIDDKVQLKKRQARSATLSLRPEAFNELSRVTFMLHRTEVSGKDLGIKISKFFTEFLGYNVRVLRKIESARYVKGDHKPLLIAPEVAFPDQYPLLIISEASIKDVNHRLSNIGEMQLPIARFRPNIIVSGIGPFEEDHWKTILVDGCKIHLVAPCARCLLPNVDCETGIKSRSNQPYKLLNSFRKVDKNQALKPVLGMHAMIETMSGRLHVGDKIVVLSQA